MSVCRGLKIYECLPKCFILNPKDLYHMNAKPKIDVSISVMYLPNITSASEFDKVISEAFPPESKYKNEMVEILKGALGLEMMEPEGDTYPPLLLNGGVRLDTRMQVFGFPEFSICVEEHEVCFSLLMDVLDC
jgi:hypothetical protein